MPDGNTANIMGIDCLGFMSKNGKKIINYVADRLALLRNESKAIWVNRISIGRYGWGTQTRA